VNFKFPKFLDGAIGPVVGKTGKIIHMMMQANFTANNIPLTKEQFIVLICLEEAPRPQSFLALITERDKGSLTRLVQGLEKKEYVVRTVSETDARINQVAVTEKGREIIQQTKPLMKGLVNSLQAGIDLEELAIATKVLEQVQANAIQKIEELEQHKSIS
jgi:DNA-binding MarR family transcriptional regulator